MKQQEKKTEALQEALMGDQKLVMDKLARERNDIDRSKVISHRYKTNQICNMKRLLFK